MSFDPVGMQQAKLLYSGEPLTGQQEYQIQRKYPQECHAVFLELAKQDGLIPEKSTLEKVVLFVNEHFSKKLAQNPIRTISASLITLSLLGTFFLKYR